ncbi:NAD(P)/FAD-dependent oxidoreductase [Neorhodopirellula lusitana]|uniref:hypothetical protein n=1 Tax=Neorhodopirellula lusitana TaxID=445327 RepID=UPI00384D297C
MTNASTSDTPRQRLAVIGAGSSGLITLKYADSTLCDWDIVCFEKSGSIRGCWGNPFPGFVSTSTKYTTQFACFPKYDLDLQENSYDKYSAFFRDGEYGQYLESFADQFDLRRFIRLQCNVTRLKPIDEGKGWELTWQECGSPQNAVAREGEDLILHTEHFDAVAVCTGLAEVPKQVATAIPTLSPSDFRTPQSVAQVHDETIVVMGGGESAVDYAKRLSKPELNNKVYLSLRSGIRVSPRIHPIRGVPSDYLRTRWMLSIHDELRNWIGERFVKTRIRYESVFRRLFPSKFVSKPGESGEQRRLGSLKAQWAMKLTRSAKDSVFDMFHNKSDDFLDAVARGDLQIIGPPTDERHSRYRTFDSICDSSSLNPNGPLATASTGYESFILTEAANAASADTLDIRPTRLIPAIGYQSRLSKLTGDTVCPSDFYLGCFHVRHRNLFLIGFARPIIGNIPSISEMQARLACRVLAGVVRLPENMETVHHQERTDLAKRYKRLDINTVYPVEMIPYCDQLAVMMDEYPTVTRIGGWRNWWRQQFTPATTLHYLADQPSCRERFERSSVCLPFVFVVLLTLLWPVDRVYRWFRS